MLEGSQPGWYPEDVLEALVVDEVMESLNELGDKIPRAKDPAELKRIREEYQANVLTQYATFVESIIQRNGGAGFTKERSVADLHLAILVQNMSSGLLDHIDAKFFEQYPGIMATCKMIDENEQVKSCSAGKN